MASIKILLRNKPNKNGDYPVVLKIIKDRKTKIISIGLSCKKKDWDSNNFQFKRSDKNHIQRNRVLLMVKEKALKIINEYYLDEFDFTLNQFEEKFRGKKMRNINVKDFWKDKINDLNLEGRTGTARSNKYVMDSLFKFCKKDLVFREITPLMLEKYTTYLRSNKNNNGGIGVRMRTIRALYNDAMNKGVVKEEYYPFKKFKVSQFKSKGKKRALSRADVKKIEKLDTNKYPHLTDAKNYFLFSYYTRGMNFIDMMKLTWSDIQDNKIYYIRNKTKKPFVIEVLPPTQKILNYYKLQNRDTNYVLPLILRENLTPIQLEYRKAKTLQAYNIKLKEIAKTVGISQNVSSYVSRHSFATNLKHAGVSTDLISQSMGHSDVNITNSYLKEFENSTVDDAVKKLLEETQVEYSLAV